MRRHRAAFRQSAGAWKACTTKGMTRACLGFSRDQCHRPSAQRHAMVGAAASSLGRTGVPRTLGIGRCRQQLHRREQVSCAGMDQSLPHDPTRRRVNGQWSGGTRNTGVEAARGELLAFCDADDVVQPGWLSAHVLALAEADVSAGVFDSWSLNGLATPSPVSYAPPPALSLFGFLPAAGSGNLAIRRRAFEDIGGFAEDLMTGEDFDLSWRAQLSGHRYVLNPDAVVARRDQQGFKAVFRRYTAYGRCGPVLYRRFRADGLRRELVLAAKTWVWLVASTPGLLQPEFRGRWARIAGWRIGRLLESVRQRVLFL